MDTARRECLTQFHRSFQHALLPLLEADQQQPLTPMMERLLRILESVEVKRFVPTSRSRGRRSGGRQTLRHVSPHATIHDSLA